MDTANAASALGVIGTYRRRIGLLRLAKCSAFVVGDGGRAASRRRHANAHFACRRLRLRHL